MDLTRLLEVTLSSDREALLTAHRFDETSCNSLCQHPSCWASQRRQEKGIPKLLPPLDDDSDSSDDELHLPKQSVCNLLDDYGENATDRYPLSTGGRPSHMWETSLLPLQRTTRSLENTKPKRRQGGPVRNSRLRLVEVQEVFDRDDLNSHWDETFVTKPYYMWVPNPKKRRRKLLRAPPNTVSDGSQPVLMKDLTDCVVPPEIEQQREETILFDEWPVLKKKQQRTRSPPSRAMQHVQMLSDTVAQSDVAIDTEGTPRGRRKKKHVPADRINELLALPKETLMKVLENTKKSDFTSKGRLHAIVQESARYDEKAQMALSTRELFKQKRMQLLEEPRWGSPNPPAPKPVYQLDDDEVLDRMSLVNTPVKDKDIYSDADSVETFPRFKKPLPGIQGPRFRRAGPFIAANRPKVPAISLGLPELPSGVRTTRPFSYKRQDLDFSLGPVFSGQSSVRSSVSGDFSDHGTTVKVNVSSTANGQGEDAAIHSVSPALSTHVPMAPAGTPATFQSPTKSAPVTREVTKDMSHLTVQTSERALPPSRDTRDDTFLSSPAHTAPAKPLTPMETRLSLNADEVLDTINETTRENQDSSVQSSRVGAGEFAMVTPTEPAVKEVQEEEIKSSRLMVKLERSHHRSIDTASSPRARSAKSVESCPSPEQWPLISETSFEKLGARPSVSEPTLSGRSDRRRPISRGRDCSPGQGPDRDFARKVLDEKRKAESPAPPPPSPEPKDPSEKAEHRMRKDLKSRDSLTMAPLFEVSELEETSPTKGFNDDDFVGDRRKGRQETTRTIQVTVPVAKSESDDGKKTEKEEVEEEAKDDGELVSQITVLNVTPKGRVTGQGPKEKVQETFLNVDIPAEDISSLKAEHGSTHQEELSSNSTVGKSHASTTGSESSLTPRGHGSQVKDDTTEGEGSHKLPAVSEDDKQVAEDSKLDETDLGDALQSSRDPLQEEGENQKVFASEVSSNMSPEMLCDSARFISYDMVSPDEDELQGDSTFLGDGLKGEDIDEVLEKDELTKATNDEQASNVVDEGETLNENSSDEVAAPGSFFFATSPNDENNQEEGKSEQIEQITEPSDNVDGEEKHESSAEIVMESENAVQENVSKEESVAKADDLPTESSVDLNVETRTSGVGQEVLGSTVEDSQNNTEGVNVEDSTDTPKPEALSAEDMQNKEKEVTESSEAVQQVSEEQSVTEQEPATEEVLSGSVTAGGVQGTEEVAEKTQELEVANEAIKTEAEQRIEDTAQSQKEEESIVGADQEKLEETREGTETLEVAAEAGSTQEAQGTKEKVDPETTENITDNTAVTENVTDNTAVTVEAGENDKPVEAPQETEPAAKEEGSNLPEERSEPDGAS